MKFFVIVINDGRNNYLQRTLESLSANVFFPEGSEVEGLIIDDWPGNSRQKRNDWFLADLAIKFGFTLVLNHENLGINKTVQKAWSLVPDDIDFIWHQENDFEYLDKINVGEMAQAMEDKNIFHVALLRQPWYDQEKKLGGIYQCAPEEYFESNVHGVDLVLHKRHFTHNPGLYPKRIAVQMEKYGEYNFKDKLLQENPEGYFSYYGKLKDAPRVLHIGELKHGKEW